MLAKLIARATQHATNHRSLNCMRLSTAKTDQTTGFKYRALCVY